jgi:heme exporter protein A
MCAAIRRIDGARYIARYGAAFGLDDFLRQRVATLSLGQKKKLLLTVTMIDEAPVWILDEPSNGLDAAGLAAVTSALSAHAERGVVILADHRGALVEAIPGVRSMPINRPA